MTGSSVVVPRRGVAALVGADATPLAEARRQHMMRLGLQAAVAVLLVLLGGGVVVLADAAPTFHGKPAPAPPRRRCPRPQPARGAIGRGGRGRRRRRRARRSRGAVPPGRRSAAAPAAERWRRRTRAGGQAGRRAHHGRVGAALRASRRRRAVWRDAAHRSRGAGGQAHHRASELGGEHRETQEGRAARGRAVDALVLLRRRQGVGAERPVGEDARRRTSAAPAARPRRRSRRPRDRAACDGADAAKPRPRRRRPRRLRRRRRGPSRARRPAASRRRPSLRWRRRRSRRNVTARTLDSQKVIHPEPHLPAIVRIQRKGTGDARFAAKVCVSNDGRVYQVNVLAEHPRRRRRDRQHHQAVDLQAAAGVRVLRRQHRLRPPVAKPAFPIEALAPCFPARWSCGQAEPSTR